MLALGCGLVASIGITQVMAKRTTANQTPAVDMTTIFVALDDIPTGDPVTPQLIKLEQWPKDKIPPGALTKLEDVENRRPKTKIYKGAPLLENQLLPKGANQGATVQIPKGYRVVAVKVDDVSGSSNMIRPGDRVDVLIHVQRDPARGIDTTKAQTILEDVKVFAINDVFDLDAAGHEKKIAARTVSLLVTPSQAEKITLATEMGKLRLVMRSFEDDTQVNSAGAVPEDLFNSNESADRGKDDPIPASTPLAKPDKTDDFLKFLNGKQPEKRQPEKLADKPAPVEPSVIAEGPKEPNNWTMRVIAAAQVNDVVLQMSDRTTPSASSQGNERWKTATSPTTEPKAVVPVSVGPAASTPEVTPAKDPQPEPATPTSDEPPMEHEKK
jgi:pilus assembly protein CpaB